MDRPSWKYAKRSFSIMTTAISATRPSSMQLSMRKRTMTTLYEVLIWIILLKQFSGQFLNILIRQKRKVATMTAVTAMMKIGPSSMIKFDDWYPASSN